jgi:hypothetical protein
MSACSDRVRAAGSRALPKVRSWLCASPGRGWRSRSVAWSARRSPPPPSALRRMVPLPGLRVSWNHTGTF